VGEEGEQPVNLLLFLRNKENELGKLLQQVNKDLDFLVALLETLRALNTLRDLLLALVDENPLQTSSQILKEKN
jgi:hypothetical protein